MNTGAVLHHATCVAVNGRGILIRGVSGSGKSALALQLIGLGAQLVADDQTALHRDGDQVIATCPRTLSGLIEARGIGILKCPPLDAAALALVVDLAATSTQRLPEPRQCDVLGVRLDLVSRIDGTHFASALMCLLSYGRHA